jgi:hypothetical protein
MRKALAYVVFATVLGLLAGCSTGPSAPTGTAQEIADKVFGKAGVEPFGTFQSLQADADKEFYLGSKDYPPFEDAVAALPMISIDTRVLVILKAADKGSVKDIVQQLEENIDPTRLICVTFSLDDVAIESRGDVILLTINTNEEQRKALVEAFKEID